MYSLSRRPPSYTRCRSSAASDVYKRRPVCAPPSLLPLLRRCRFAPRGRSPSPCFALRRRFCARAWPSRLLRAVAAWLVAALHSLSPFFRPFLPSPSLSFSSSYVCRHGLRMDTTGLSSCLNATFSMRVTCIASFPTFWYNLEFRIRKIKSCRSLPRLPSKTIQATASVVPC